MSNTEQAVAAEGVPLRLETKPWAPLVIPLYRSFWLAGLFSNLGTWMHETGAQWLMNELEATPIMVSAVRTAMTIPIFCLALPAGVWADRFDRRGWLLLTQSLLLTFAAIMSILDLVGWMTPALLLTLTVCLGVASILNQPAWQALTPELVPPALVPSAVAVGSISFNLARSLGPALAGLLIASIGTWVTFLFNALSFLAVIGVLLWWQPGAVHHTERAREPFFRELKSGLKWIGSSAMLRSVLVRVFLFALPASCLWSLLSLVASQQLGLGARGFGILLAAIGAGAVLGAGVLPWFRARHSNERIVIASEFVYAAVCVALAMASSLWFAFTLLLVLGAVWMSTMTTLNATAQVNLPRKFRARGMASYLMAFACGMAVGSALWGQLAANMGLQNTFMLAAGVLVVTALAAHRLPLGEWSERA